VVDFREQEMQDQTPASRATDVLIEQIVGELSNTKINQKYPLTPS
jgi:hypothetical protein